MDKKPDSTKRRHKKNKRRSKSPNSSTTSTESTGSNSRGNWGRSDVGRNAPMAGGGRLQASGGRGGGATGGGAGGSGGGGGSGGRRGRNKMAAQQQNTSTPGQQHSRTPCANPQMNPLPGLYQKSSMEKRLLSDFMPGSKFNQKNDSSRKNQKAAVPHSVGKQAAEHEKSPYKPAELTFPTKNECGNILPAGIKEQMKIKVPHLTDSSNRCAEDNIEQIVPEITADTKVESLEHSRDNYAQPVTFPMQARTQPEDLNSRLASALDLSGEIDFPEPTSPAYSDNDCSFMTYSSDGISVIISNGGCVLHDEPHSVVPHTAKSDLEKFEKALCIEVPKQDSETDDGVKSVKSISPVYTPGSTCPDLTFSGSSPVLNSLDSVSPVDSAWSSRTLSPLSCDGSSPSVLTTTTSTATTSSSMVTTTTPTTLVCTPTTPVCSKIPSSNSSSSPGNVNDTWLWLPAIIPPLTLLLRWIWFPAPPPNLPWRDPVLKDDEKAALTAHYYMSGHPPDSFNIQCIEGRWKKDPHWRWIPSNGDVSDGGHWYELPTPPEPARGAWYLVWPAELPMGSSPFIPGQGTWLTGSHYSKNNVMPQMLVPQKNLPLMY